MLSISPIVRKSITVRKVKNKKVLLIACELVSLVNLSEILDNANYVVTVTVKRQRSHTCIEYIYITI